MKRQPGRAGEMPAEHALLGLIVLGGGEAYGYDLARHFDAEQPLGAVLRLEQAMLYQHLKKLERREWLSGSLRQQGSRPPRQMYHVTAAGRAELRRWLEAPVARTREIRLEFLVKLFIARQLDPGLARRLVAEQLAISRQHVASLAAAIAQPVAPDGATAAESQDVDFQRLVLDLRLAQTQAAVAWLEQIAAGETGAPA
jgi:PadR family transcriptional regulator AphA